MAYCRIGPDSDVYLYTDGDTWRCVGCDLDARPLDDDGALGLPTPADALVHLLAHRAAGHRVPDAAIERLRSETIDTTLRDAPLDDEPTTENEQRAAEEAREALRRGEVVSQDEMRRILEIEKK